MTRALRVSLFILMLAFVTGFAECYKPVTKNQLPSRIKTVAVPAFQMESQALRYKIESRFTEAVMKELVHRGRGLRVQGEREGAFSEHPVHLHPEHQEQGADQRLAMVPGLSGGLRLPERAFRV